MNCKIRHALMVSTLTSLGLLVFSPALARPLAAEPAPADAATEPAEPTVNLLDDAQYEARLEAASGDVRRQVDVLRELRQARTMREMVLRRDEPDAAEILKQIDELQAELRARQEALETVFSRDEEWARVNQQVEAEQAAMTEARGGVIRLIQERKRLESAQRDAQMKRDGTLPVPETGAAPVPVDLNLMLPPHPTVPIPAAPETDERNDGAETP